MKYKILMFFSDHASIHLDINCKIHNNHTKPTQPVTYIKTRWIEEKSKEFDDIINSDESELCLQEISDKIDNAHTVNEKLIDECVSNLSNVFNMAGKSHSKTYSQDNTEKGKQMGGRWYDQICKNKKAVFENFMQIYKTSRRDEDRISMCKARNEYRKVCRQKIKKYQLAKSKELMNMKKR